MVTPAVCRIALGEPRGSPGSGDVRRACYPWTATQCGSTPNPQPRVTTAYYAQAAIAFGTGLGAAVLGIAYLPIDPWQRAFLAVSLLFVVTSAFTLAKCVRDQQESSTVRVRLDEARMGKLLAEHDPFKVVA